jgi:uncharacterized RDD family membrane protein YckC
MSVYGPPPDGPPGPAEPVDELGEPLAAWGQRLVAFVIDELFIFVITELAKFAVGLRHTFAGQILALAMAIGYYAVLNGSELGQTFGKRAMYIQVRDVASGGRIDPQRAGLRYLVVGLFRIVPFFMLFTLFDGLWALWDRDRQALHDKIAGTEVVRVTES